MEAAATGAAVAQIAIGENLVNTSRIKRMAAAIQRAGAHLAESK